jgi:hypothetical protein
MGQLSQVSQASQGGEQQNLVVIQGSSNIDVPTLTVNLGETGGINEGVNEGVLEASSSSEGRAQGLSTDQVSGSGGVTDESQHNIANNANVASETSPGSEN